MRIGIDASNIRGTGGGGTHLIELLRSARSTEHGFERIVVWGNSSTLASLEDRPWLLKSHQQLLDQSLPSVFYWQKFMLDRLVVQEHCDVLFVPGGSYSGAFRPFVTMSQNMLPFEWPEARRYGISLWTFKFVLLRYIQSTTFKRANGLIFLTEYARKTVSRFLGNSVPQTCVIPHGVDERFRKTPKFQNPISDYVHDSPFRILYVSKVTPYKHQWCVIEAIWRLRQSGLPVTLDLVGSIYNCKMRFLRAMTRFDPRHEWIRYHGNVPYTDLHVMYHKADIFLFASSCENLPNILLEAMSAGLPIACSNRGPMPDVLGEAGIYFNPEKPLEIAQATKLLIDNPILRQQISLAAYKRAKEFTWERCARETFDFFSRFAR